MTRGIEIHNGKVVFGIRGDPLILAKDQEVIDIDVSPKAGITALGTAKVIRVRGNVSETDLTTGELRVLDIEARAAKNIPFITGVLINPMAKAGVDISGEFRGIQCKMEVDEEGGTIAECFNIQLVTMLKTAPTLSAYINFQSGVGYNYPTYGMNFAETNFTTAWCNFHDDSTIVDADGSLGAAAGFIMIAIDGIQYKLQTYATS